MINPAATTETAARQATAMRDWLLGQSPEQIKEFQKTSITRLAKTKAVRPALVTAGINSDRKTVADAVYELMTTDLRPELARIKAPIEIVYAYDAFFGFLRPECMRCTVKPMLLLPMFISRGSMTVFTLSCLISPSGFPAR